MSFDRAFDFVVGHEGGYVFDPQDRGGETKFGISKLQYPTMDIPNLTIEDAKEIYLNDYWRRCQCDVMEYPLAVMVFDCAVNQGQPTAVRLLQDAVGVHVDGIIGPHTLEAVKAAPPHSTTREMALERIMLYTQAAMFHRFGRGWTVRVLDVLIEGI